jgi:membrane protein implicated in regulation of membrane protease activity
MEESFYSDPKIRLSRKEMLSLIIAISLALGSFKLDDPYVVISMLIVAGAASVLFCVWYHGKVLWRVFTAVVLLLVLAFIGWRDLRRPESISAHSGTTRNNRATTIEQTATDSDYSNLVAGSDAKIKCTAEGERHVKDKVTH